MLRRGCIAIEVLIGLACTSSLGGTRRVNRKQISGNANEQASCIITIRDDLQEDTVRRPERRVIELFELSRTGGSLNTINEDRF